VSEILIPGGPNQLPSPSLPLVPAYNSIKEKYSALVTRHCNDYLVSWKPVNNSGEMLSPLLINPHRISAAEMYSPSSQATAGPGASLPSFCPPGPNSAAKSRGCQEGKSHSFALGGQPTPAHGRAPHTRRHLGSGPREPEMPASTQQLLCGSRVLADAPSRSTLPQSHDALVQLSKPRPREVGPALQPRCT
jgi:hypothetical protein